MSKQLSDLKQECSELRKERNKKGGQLNNVSSKNEEKEAVLCHSKNSNSDRDRDRDREGEALGLYHAEISRRSQNAISSTTSSCKAIGVQTDVGGICAKVFLNDDLPTHRDLSKKLLGIWGLPVNPMLGRNMVSNLLVACQTDLHVLFGFMGMNMSVKTRMDSPACESSTTVSQYHLQSSYSLEAAKVSHLYSVLTKINNGMIHVEGLLKPLLDLCSLESVVIVHKSLHILHMFLQHLFSFVRNSGERDNIMVEELCSGNGVLNPNGSEAAKEGDTFSVSKEKTSLIGCSPCDTKFLDDGTLFEKGPSYPGALISVSRVDWLSLFEEVLQIAMRKTEEIVRVEAVSILNIILIRSNAYTDREKFGNTQMFESISQLLRKEAGLQVQNHSIQLLYLLLNCPKLLVTFCSGCSEGVSPGFMNDNTEDTSAFLRFTLTLQSLADCLSCAGNGLEELKLRRNAINLLAFLASSGKSGFDILVSHKLSKDANFLMLILQVLVSEMDIEATVITNSPEVFNERTLLMREALILLNRLVSNSAYSATALQLLTKSRDMASLTIDIANRLSRNDQTRDRFDGMVKTKRKSEVADLARVFKKRVFTYMGDYIS